MRKKDGLRALELFLMDAEMIINEKGHTSEGYKMILACAEDYKSRFSKRSAESYFFDGLLYTKKIFAETEELKINCDKPVGKGNPRKLEDFTEDTAAERVEEPVEETRELKPLSEERNDKPVRKKGVGQFGSDPSIKTDKGYLVYGNNLSPEFIPELKAEFLPEKGSYMSYKQIEEITGLSHPIIAYRLNILNIEGKVKQEKINGRVWSYLTPELVREIDNNLRRKGRRKQVQDPFEKSYSLRDVVQQAGEPYAESWEIAQVCGTLGIDVPEGGNVKMVKDEAKKILIELKKTRVKESDNGLKQT